MLLKYGIQEKETKRKIQMDVKRHKNKGTIWDLAELFWFDYAFRAVFYYRLSRKAILKKLYPIPPTIEIGGEIGEGFSISHFYSVVYPHKMGKNCTVMQGVTVGKGKTTCNGSRPVIGDNVTICANAVVVGGITIGSNVIIGAGAVVISDLPDNSVAVGVPAKIVKKYN